jgi:hypothetical protein
MERYEVELKRLKDRMRVDDSFGSRLPTTSVPWAPDVGLGDFGQAAYIGQPPAAAQLLTAAPQADYDGSCGRLLRATASQQVQSAARHFFGMQQPPQQQQAVPVSEEMREKGEHVLERKTTKPDELQKLTLALRDFERRLKRRRPEHLKAKLQKLADELQKHKDERKRRQLHLGTQARMRRTPAKEETQMFR